MLKAESSLMLGVQVKWHRGCRLFLRFCALSMCRAEAMVRRLAALVTQNEFCIHCGCTLDGEGAGRFVCRFSWSLVVRAVRVVFPQIFNAYLDLHPEIASKYDHVSSQTPTTYAMTVRTSPLWGPAPRTAITMSFAPWVGRDRSRAAGWA